MSRPVKIVIADDHEIVLDGLKSILNPAVPESDTKDSDEKSSLFMPHTYPFQIIGIAQSGEDLLAKISGFRHADILIIDYSMQGMNGLEAAIKVKAELPHIKVILFSMYESDALIKEVFAQNIEGYVTKVEGRKRLLDVIKRVYKGEKVYPQLKNTSGNSTIFISPKTSTDLPLSKREREIVCEIVNGLTTEKIADKLKISFNTVEVHRNNIYRKLDINKVADLVKIALENNLCSD